MELLAVGAAMAVVNQLVQHTVDAPRWWDFWFTHVEFPDEYTLLIDDLLEDPSRGYVTTQVQTDKLEWAHNDHGTDASQCWTRKAWHRLSLLLLLPQNQAISSFPTLHHLREKRAKISGRRLQWDTILQALHRNITGRNIPARHAEHVQLQTVERYASAADTECGHFKHLPFSPLDPPAL